MANKDLKLTSVKIHQDMMDQFKVMSVKTKFTLQKIVNRSLHMYLNDVEFRNIIHNYNVLTTSGSL